MDVAFDRRRLRQEVLVDALELLLDRRHGRRYQPVEAELFPRVKAMAQALASYPEWPFEEEAPGFEGPAGWACPGKPWCSLPNCLAKRYPNGLKWSA